MPNLCISFSIYYSRLFLEAQLTHGRLVFSVIYPLFLDIFGRSLRVCHLELYKEASSDGCRIENTRYRWGALNFN